MKTLSTFKSGHDNLSVKSSNVAFELVQVKPNNER
ncbi:MAG: hypothetical protein FD137_1393 [Spirochaetes bacterium]|nr:MAG: hypothetical protein FD137_1393 [Spirochaetota bacterium]